MSPSQTLINWLLDPTRTLPSLTCSQNDLPTSSKMGQISLNMIRWVSRVVEVCAFTFPFSHNFAFCFTHASRLTRELLCCSLPARVLDGLYCLAQACHHFRYPTGSSSVRVPLLLTICGVLAMTTLVAGASRDSRLATGSRSAVESDGRAGSPSTRPQRRRLLVRMRLCPTAGKENGDFDIARASL